MKNIKLQAIDYHRNGIAGVGFHVVTFYDLDNGPMLAILFDGPGRVAVLNRDLLAQGEIEFGKNSWRGDEYEAQLRQAIAASEV